MKKIVFLITAIFGLFGWSWASQEYLYFYGSTCAHCQKVEKYFEEQNIEKDYKLSKYEVFENAANRELLGSYLEKLNLGRDQV